MQLVSRKPMPAGQTDGKRPSAQHAPLRQVEHGVEVLDNLRRARHRHLDAYATVVVSGTFEESSYAGRIRATAGDVLVHPQLDAHENHHVSSTVKLIRLPWIDRCGTGGLYRLKDLDELARVAETDVPEASERLAHAVLHGLSIPCGLRNDWPDQLAADLANDVSMSLGHWASRNGLAPETVSRGFSKAYGTTPEVFRAELKAKAALFRITHADDRLGEIAAEAGFADQAHMTRWIHRLTGLSPTTWRGLATGRRYLS
ncbi:helix-turn-helix transcriptional regulator [Rhodanobacter sp. 7MK24]|uniref:helix-turn-helix domain-containing protein n=1 Tax=Rhodanobacter sp. 7MK24 TaxID=2775922 RepID=UPI00177E3087|nr:AraC family transcriptional regulator [Rhodanobacter sp. 7MK24]MBD8880770.1 helix-turn-helix transcriptional regulator [Rhodanobacter sp. 7MK24]